MHLKITLALVFVSLLVLGQKKKDVNQVDLNKKALIEQIDDVRLKIDYLVDLYAKDTTNVIALKDLASLYYRSKAYKEAFNVCQLIIRKEKENVFAIRMIAGVYEQGNQIEEAIIYYQKLLAIKETPQDFYQLASLYFKNSNFKSAQHYLNKILSSQNEGESVMITYEKEGKLYNQLVPINAAALNMIGFVYMNSEQIEQAKEVINAALKIFPEFELAKGNLNYLNGVE